MLNGTTSKKARRGWWVGINGMRAFMVFNELHPMPIGQLWVAQCGKKSGVIWWIEVKDGYRGQGVMRYMLDNAFRWYPTMYTQLSDRHRM